ncbi:OsmC family protein [Limnohabitans sp.]|uniref:OsmC family protein n=1 Tax=Limnohabitans sp. TaxID=1907725 RepID=UPI0033423701
MSGKTIRVELSQRQDYRFDIVFGDDMSVLTSDEPAPLGTGLGPSPMHMLCAAVGNCLSDSLLFAFRKFKQVPEPIHCVVTADVGRNDDNRLRVLHMNAQIRMGVLAASLDQLDHVLAQFEEFCTVTQSVRQGIPITVEVFDSAGQQLK